MNINSLDVLNHKRLLDSARADPSAVSFQVRPVDVVSGTDVAKRPSFGSLDTLQLLGAEVRRGGGGAVGTGGRARGRTPLRYMCAGLDAPTRAPAVTVRLPEAAERAAARACTRAAGGAASGAAVARQVPPAAAAARLWLLAQPPGALRCAAGVAIPCLVAARSCAPASDAQSRAPTQ